VQQHGEPNYKGNTCILIETILSLDWMSYKAHGFWGEAFKGGRGVFMLENREKQLLRVGRNGGNIRLNLINLIFI